MPKMGNIISESPKTSKNIKKNIWKERKDDKTQNNNNES